MDVTDERSIELAAARCVSSGPLRLVIVATGVLHDGDTLQPEKSWLMLNADRLSKVFAINTIGPALVAKHFLPLLDRHHRCIFAALSARVGSISDNRLGGWYGYRASKAGLNMIIKTLSIELQRRNKFAICLGLHPGTVDSGLSAPFQANVAQPKLFSATRAASELLSVIDQANAEQSGRVLAWDGQEVPS
jgi:NAD(P)-dependent dehydrogenase (short-subunit alcohol dehydrogenase family)